MELHVVLTHFFSCKSTLCNMIVDGMAFRDSYMSWMEKSKKEGKDMLESFADTCRNQKVVI